MDADPLILRALAPWRACLRSKSAVLGLEIVTNPIDEATKVVTIMNGLKDGPVKTYLFREYPGTLEAAITLAMQEGFSLRQAKLHANVPRQMPRPTMKSTGGPEPMDLSSAMAAGSQQRRGPTNVRCFRCGNNGHYARECTAPVHAAKGRRDDTGYRHGQQKHKGNQQARPPLLVMPSSVSTSDTLYRRLLPPVRVTLSARRNIASQTVSS
ncbi:unnamed protein product [Phytophthora fragariaefolia]|uniref:Unnamed protein product n=1 Tax=Phytophthora fragariaefolia TaxID=1490495 RepID=A0A9W6YGL1_9STRA|nr:unnamed protein product [Phytophthora fragariaefolia]